MPPFYRPSSEVERQIAEFKATLPEGITGPPPGDFAAQLQWDAWQGHLVELQTELDAAIAHELEDSELNVALDGDPVSGHAIHAGFLGAFLSKAQSLVHAIAQLTEQHPVTVRGSVTSNIISDYKLIVGGVYASSFGLKLRLPDESELDHLRLARSEAVMGDFCKLMDPQVDERELARLLASPRVRSNYRGLIETVAKYGAQVSARTPGNRRGTRMTANHARDRMTWLESFKSATETLQLTGSLIGGNIGQKRFELIVDDESYKGTLSESACEQLRHMHLGDIVQAQIEQTTLTSEDGSAEGSVSYHLVRLERAK